MCISKESTHKSGLHFTCPNRTGQSHPRITGIIIIIIISNLNIFPFKSFNLIRLKCSETERGIQTHRELLSTAFLSPKAHNKQASLKSQAWNSIQGFHAGPLLSRCGLLILVMPMALASSVSELPLGFPQSHSQLGKLCQPNTDPLFSGFRYQRIIRKCLSNVLLAATKQPHTQSNKFKRVARTLHLMNIVCYFLLRARPALVFVDQGLLGKAHRLECFPL